MWPVSVLESATYRVTYNYQQLTKGGDPMSSGNLQTAMSVDAHGILSEPLLRD
jgi:hypothetical protein